MLSIPLSTLDAIRDNTIGERLDLSGQNLGDDDAAALAEALQFNTSLHTINLKNNKIGPVGAEVLGKALKENSTVTTLDVSNNLFGDKGGLRFIEAISGNTALIDLNLDLCPATANKIATAFFSNKLDNSTLTQALGVLADNIALFASFVKYAPIVGYFANQTTDIIRELTDTGRFLISSQFNLIEPENSSVTATGGSVASDRSHSFPTLALLMLLLTITAIFVNLLKRHNKPAPLAEGQLPDSFVKNGNAYHRLQQTL